MLADVWPLGNLNFSLLFLVRFECICLFLTNVDTEEFVAHNGNVNCLSIGKKTCRLFITGGDDHRVNLWSIGKPTSLMSLSGHASPVESLAFDSSEVLVAAGASAGAIKLWDLEETKMVRTLTGHRSNCTAVEFHPFGEFFASGSTDTNLKVWDIRKKGCIHTYKGHTKGISKIRFTPDGRWVVSGGFDNVVKVWDLTAGKLLHDFKFHQGHVRTIDFHPLEFLMATGSADKTVKFWDLETFELIGSSRPEATGVRSFTFHPDGRTLFCGFDNHLKVFSWEPIICHDALDMGWSTLGDLLIYDGRLLGCSYYQNSVGVWVADILLIEPYGAVVPEKTSSLNQKYDPLEDSLKKIGRHWRSNSSLQSAYLDDNESKEIKNIYVDSVSPTTSRKMNSLNSAKVVLPSNAKDFSSLAAQQPAVVPQAKVIGQPNAKSFTVPTIVPRDSPDGKDMSGRSATGVSLKSTHIRRQSAGKLDTERLFVPVEIEPVEKIICDSGNMRDAGNLNSLSRLGANNDDRDSTEDKNSYMKSVTQKLEKILSPVTPSSQENCNVSPDRKMEMNSIKYVNGVAVVRGRTRSLVERFERRQPLSGDEFQTPNAASSVTPDKASSIARDVASSIACDVASSIAIDAGSSFARDATSSLARDAASSLARDAASSFGWDAASSFARDVASSFARDAASSIPRDVASNFACDAASSFPPDGVSIVPPDAASSVTLHAAFSVTPHVASSVTPHAVSGITPDASNIPPTQNGLLRSSRREPIIADDHRIIEDVMQSHDVLLSGLRSRLTKLRMVRHFWEQNNIKGAINAIKKQSDHSVQTDVISVLLEKMEILTLDMFSCLLPVLLGLLDSKTERHVNVSLEVLLKLVAVFGPVIRSTISAMRTVGVDLQAEQRREWCKECFIQLQKVQALLPALIRRGGVLARCAQELNLVLQEP